MVTAPPSTGIPGLDEYLRSVNQTLLELAEESKPEDGWKLTDLESPVSEVIGDKRDLIDIVSKWDDSTISLDGWQSLTDQQSQAISELKKSVEKIISSSETFESIMMWWDANYRTIFDVKEHTEVIHGDMESINASEANVTQMKQDVTTLRDQVVVDRDATLKARGESGSARDAAVVAQGKAESAEDAAKDSADHAAERAEWSETSANNAAESEALALEHSQVTVAKISAPAVVIDVTDKIVGGDGVQVCDSAIVTIVGGTAQLEILNLTYQKGTWGPPSTRAVVEAKYRPSPSSSRGSSAGQIVYAESGKESACLKMNSTGWLYGYGFTVGKPYSGKITWPLSSMQIPILDAEQKLIAQVATSAAAAKTSETNAAAFAATAETTAETAVARVVDGAPEDLDTIREVAEYAQDNQDVMDALNAAIGQKAPKTHTHPVEDVTGLGDRLDGLDQAVDGKAPKTHTHTSSEISDAASTVTADRVVRADSTGHIAVPEPTLPADPTPKTYVDNAITTTKAYVDKVKTTADAALPASKIQVVAELPESPLEGTIYLVTGA